MTGSRLGQRGATIIVALLVVGLVAIVAAQLIAGQDRWYRQVKLEGDRLQAMALADAAVDYGRAVLADDGRRDHIDHRGEAWAQPLPPMSVEGGLLSGSIEELQGRLNLNALTTDPRPLENLWAQLGLPAEQMAALADYIDGDSEPKHPGGAEDQYYLGIARPYRAANTALTTLDDLRAVRGFDAATVERLREHVAAYPPGPKLNVNTAPVSVLMAVLPGLARGQAEALRRSLGQSPVRDAAGLAEVLREVGWEGAAVPALGFDSRYFLVRGEVRWGEVSVRMRVAVERPGPGAVPRVMWKQMEADE
jgi:general secretion pathway protein K